MDKLIEKWKNSEVWNHYLNVFFHKRYYLLIAYLQLPIFIKWLAYVIPNKQPKLKI